MRAIRTDFVILFVLGGCLSLLAVPLKVLFWLPDSQDILAFVPMPERTFWHGHELLAGYSQIVLGGYLLTRPGRTIIRLFIVLWLIARGTIFIPTQTGTYLGAICNVAVFGVLFSYAGLAFFRAAKRLKSAAPGIIILFLLLAEVAFQTGETGHLPMLQETALR
ncbi:NnrS family protein, partial [Thalassospira lucentensis]